MPLLSGQLMLFGLLAALIAVRPSSGLPRDHLDALVNAAVDAGTFQNPSVNVRPRFRYWTPDASADPDYLRSDVSTVGAIGAGGFELLGYYLYGGTPEGTGNFSPVDWSIYGWGTPAWRDQLNVVAQAHRDNGLIMDFAMGPNQGQGVPAEPGIDGLAWDLYPYNLSIPVGSSFDGVIPGIDRWGLKALQAVVTGLTTDKRNVTIPYEVGLAGAGLSGALNSTGVYPALPGSNGAPNRTQVVLSSDSLQVHTEDVAPDGRLSFHCPSDEAGIECNLFVIYLIHSDYRAQASPSDIGGPQTIPQTFLQNGSWAVDHFSAAGARVITDFWEHHLLTNGTRELLMEVGNYGWEDSIEIRNNVYWTKALPAVFSAEHGYDVTRWLPILFHQNRLGFGGEPPVWWITDEDDAGNNHIADYRSTLGHLYNIYLKTLNRWANEYLDVQFSAQPAYNLPIDMLGSIPHIDAPECESLGFNHLVDGYRYFNGPANLAGKRVISTECGANSWDGYQQTIPELLWDVKRSIAGGMNQFVFHGYVYSGPYGNTSWPGFTPFWGSVSEMHGPRQPGWEVGYSDAMNYTARLSYIFQSGVPRVDLAFYMKITTFPGIRPNYIPTDLEQAGYSYEYISPDNFNLPEAYVEDGIFAPERQGFKAMIIRANDSMTPYGVQKLAQYAHAGLPMVFSGGMPDDRYLLTSNSSEKDVVRKILESLTSLPNVHIVPFEGLADAIASLGITPNAKVSADAIWWTRWRRDDAKRMDYVFLSNVASFASMGTGFSEGTVEFASKGIPYTFDAWTGEQIPITNYTQSENSTTIFFRLAGNQTSIVAFSDFPLPNITIPFVHATSGGTGILDFAVSERGGLVVKSGSQGSNTTIRVTTSDGKTHHVLPCVAKPITLSNWTLIVESWHPSSNLSDITFTEKRNSTYHLRTLSSWQDIPGLQNISGRGFYSTTFTWNHPLGKTGAIINFGAVFHTLRVSVNGHQLPPLDPTLAKVDISRYLVDGLNCVEAVASTTLVNALKPIAMKLENSGTTGTVQALASLQDYGLLMPVVVTPYRKTVLGAE
ncbi:hypothetical protein BFJ63_vAg15487 [Fusarium oxysporum f. sp. narcissi]|uniref:Secreted protein n=1 Tax=Fusarium oxysporum f. sp. narcissi TaxID=451672 RepID=A0A4Q2VCA4_FUSOX|nr:hypothetical protein BFJ63_vAg15487 [Fusarium oxysporum f. sp. narcissi]